MTGFKRNRGNMYEFIIFLAGVATGMTIVGIAYMQAESEED